MEISLSCCVNKVEISQNAAGNILQCGNLLNIDSQSIHSIHTGKHQSNGVMLNDSLTLKVNSDREESSTQITGMPG